MAIVVRWISLFLILFGGNTSVIAHENTNVLATIKPLQLMVKAIAGDIVEVDVLLDPQQSPHSYQLRPSDREKVDQAAQIFWIGPSLETFLSRTFQSIPPQRLETLGDASPLTSHDHGELLENDPHLWMDHAQILLISKKIEKKLTQLYPQHAKHFSQNQQTFISKITEINNAFKKEFIAFKDQGLVQSHASFNRLLINYGLNERIALSDEHGRAASVKQWRKIEKFMEEESPHCLLTDPSEKNSLQETFLQRFPVTVVETDPMASRIPVSTSGFIDFYRQLSDDILNCMKKN